MVFIEIFLIRNSIPTNQEILMQSGIPFAIHFTPMSFLENQQEVKRIIYSPISKHST
jgi:hypothetical protein